MLFPDVNECQKDPDICVNGNCVNNKGSFQCECEFGHILDPSGKVCIGSETNAFSYFSYYMYVITFAIQLYLIL